MNDVNKTLLDNRIDALDHLYDRSSLTHDVEMPLFYEELGLEEFRRLPGWYPLNVKREPLKK